MASGDAAAICLWDEQSKRNESMLINQLVLSSSWVFVFLFTRCVAPSRRFLKAFHAAMVPRGVLVRAGTTNHPTTPPPNHDTTQHNKSIRCDWLLLFNATCTVFCSKTRGKPTCIAHSRAANRRGVTSASAAAAAAWCSKAWPHMVSHPHLPPPQPTLSHDSCGGKGGAVRV